MIVIRTAVHVKGISGRDITDFMLNTGDNGYRDWWPGMHLAFHTLKRTPGDRGNLVYFDEYVGRRRLKFKAVVDRLVPGREIVWQLIKLVRLPVRLGLALEDEVGGMITADRDGRWRAEQGPPARPEARNHET